MKFDEFFAELEGPRVMGKMSLSSKWLVQTGWTHAILEAIKVAEKQEGSPVLNDLLRELLP